MDFRHASGAIWRATSAFRPFHPPVSLKPTATFRVLALQQKVNPSRICGSCRCLSTAPIRLQEQRQSSGVAEPRPDADDGTTESPILTKPTTSPKSDVGLDGEDRSLLDEALDLNHAAGIAAKRTQHFHSTRAQTAHRTPSIFSPEQQQSTPSMPNAGNSYTDALNALSEAMKPAAGKGTSPSIYNDLLFPSSATSTSTTPTLPSRPPPRHEITHLRLSSRTGRTIEVFPNDPADLALKLKRLSATVVRNKVPQDFIRQRFHERPGLKRKRLHSQRWRAKFKLGFGSMVGKVAEMRRMGW